METVLYIVHILVCLALLPIILLQSGKGGGVSATFGGGGAGTVFGSRGASSFLQRLTSGAAVLFMITSMWLSWFASQSRSVVSETREPPAPAAESRSGHSDEVPMPAATGSAAQGATAPAPAAPAAEQAAPAGEK